MMQALSACDADVADDERRIVIVLLVVLLVVERAV